MPVTDISANVATTSFVHSAAAGANYSPSNGWLSGGLITYTPGSIYFSITSVTCRFTNYTNEAVPVPGPIVTFPAMNNIASVDPGNPATSIIIKSDGSIVQDPLPTDTVPLYADYIHLGAIVQQGGVIVAVSNSKYPLADRYDLAVVDMVQRIGPFNLGPNTVAPSTSLPLDLSISLSGGVIWDHMSNVVTNRAVPSLKTLPPVDRPVMLRGWRNTAQELIFSGASDQLDTLLYNPMGTGASLVSITAGYWVNLPVMYSSAADFYLVQYPDHEYLTKEAAKANTTGFIRYTDQLMHVFDILGVVTVQQGATDLTEAEFSTGMFFNYTVALPSSNNPSTGDEDRLANCFTVDQVFGDDTTGVITLLNYPFLTYDAAAVKATSASSTNPYSAHFTPGTHVLPTMVMKPDIHIIGDAQRACILQVSSNYITLGPSFATAVDSTTGLYNLSTGVGTNVNWDLRSVGGTGIESHLGLYSVFLEEPLNYTGRIFNPGVSKDSGDILTINGCDFEETITLDGGEILLYNSEVDQGHDIVFNATTANTTAIITSLNCDRLIVNGNVSGVTNVVTIAGSTMNYLEGNGANVTIKINRGSLPPTYSVFNGANIVITSDILTANETDGIHGALVPLSAGNVVVDMSTYTSGMSSKVDKTATVNGHNFTLGNVVVSASDLTTGTVSKTVLPLPLGAADISQSLTSNTSGTAANLTAAALLPNGTTATTQANSDSSGKLATTNFVNSYVASLAGHASGLATLDSSGYVPTSQINLSDLGALSYQGTWDASVNHTYPAATGGQFWIVNAAGTVGPNPSAYYDIGDWFIYNSNTSAFDRVASTVSSYLTTWPGSGAIVTVGTITTGTWSADVISNSKGGAGSVTGILKADGSGNVTAAVPDSDVSPDYVSASGDGTISGDKDFTGAVTVVTQTYTDSSTNAASTAYVQSVANISESNVIYMSSAGGYSDGYHDGSTIGKAVDTLAHAMTLAASFIPSLNNQILIECFEARVDTAVTFVAYTNLEAPSMILNGALSIEQNTSVRVKRIGTVGVPTSVTFENASVSTSYANLFSNRILGAPITVAANQGLRIMEVPIIDGFAPTDPCITVYPGSTLYLKCAILYGLVSAIGVGSVIDLTQVGDISHATFSWNPVQNLIRFPPGNAGGATGILKSNGQGVITAATAPNDYLLNNQSISLNTDVAGTSVNAGGATTITTTIQAGVVTLGKMASLAAGSVIGNPNFGTPATPSAVSLSSASTPLTVIYRDSDSNVAANHMSEAYQALSMAGVDINLGLTNAPLLEFNGLADTNVYLPDATTLVKGFKYDMRNSSAANSVFVYTHSLPPGTLIATLTPGLCTCFILKDTSTQTGQWYQETIVATMSSGYLMGNISGSVTPPSFIPVSAPMSANSVILRDANQNAASNNFVSYLGRTNTSAGTLNLTNASPCNQEWYGTTAGFKVYLPSYAAVSLGFTFSAVNSSDKSVSVYVNGGVSPLQVMTPLMCAKFTCNSAVAESWLVIPMNQSYTLSGTISGGSLAAAPTTINTSIANGTLTGTMMASATVQGSNIAANTVTGGASGNLALTTITNANIVAGTITGGASGSIGSATITAANIVTNTITGGASGNIALATITGGNIASATVAGSNIGANTVTGGASGNLALTTITNANIVAGTITGGSIASATITSANIAANTITGGASGNLALTTITGGNIALATISNTNIIAGTITGGAGGNIASNTITNANIFAGTITGGVSGSIGSATVTAYNIASATILSGNIAANTITGGASGNIALATITGSNLVGGTITATQIASNTITMGNMASVALNTVLANTTLAPAPPIAYQISQGYILGNLSGTLTAVQATASNTATTVVTRDSSSNTYANSFTVPLNSPGAAINLTISSNPVQYYNSGTFIVTLPNVTTGFTAGRTYTVINDGTGTIIVKDGAANILINLTQWMRCRFVLVTTGSAAGVWALSTSMMTPPLRLVPTPTSTFAVALPTTNPLTAAQLYNGPIRCANSNVTLTLPTYEALIGDLTTPTSLTGILGFTPPNGFNFRSIFVPGGNGVHITLTGTGITGVAYVHPSGLSYTSANGAIFLIDIVIDTVNTQYYAITGNH